MERELAETGQLESLLSQMGQALDTYLSFAHPDAQQSEINWQAQLMHPVPAQGVGIQTVNELLASLLIPHASAIPRPGFCGYITTGSVTASTLALTAASVCSPQRYFLNAFAMLEELSLNWLADMLSIAPMQGVYSSGGSVANLIALGGARQWAFEQQGVDPAQDGMTQPVRIYASDQCHHTIQRAAGVLGVGRRAVKSIATGADGRIDIVALQQALAEDSAAGILPMAVVANAGTTNTGSIDPLRAVGELAKAYNAWFHIDGAYGLPGLLDDSKRALYDGLELADSVIIDPHKWLGASVGVAATFVRDRDVLRRAFMQEAADYLEGSLETDGRLQGQHSIDDFGIPYFDYSLELSSPCRGVIVWSMLKEIGVDGLRQRVIRHNRMAQDLAHKVRQSSKLELLQEPTLSICCFRYHDERITDLNAFNQSLVRTMVVENRVMPSTTRVGDRLAIRPCFIGARHEPELVDQIIADVIRHGDQLLAQWLSV